MKFEVSTDYLGAITLATYEHVTIELPDGRYVTVYDDMIYVATAGEHAAKKDGKKIWRARSPQRFPHGKVLSPGDEPEQIEIIPLEPKKVCP